MCGCVYIYISFYWKMFVLRHLYSRILLALHPLVVASLHSIKSLTLWTSYNDLNRDYTNGSAEVT